MNTPLQIITNPSLKITLQYLKNTIYPKNPFHINTQFQNKKNTSTTNYILTIHLNPKTLITTTNTNIQINNKKIIITINSLLPKKKNSIQLKNIFTPKFPTKKTTITTNTTLTYNKNTTINTKTLLTTISTTSKITINIIINKTNILTKNTISYTLNYTNNNNSPTNPFTIKYILPKSLTIIKSQKKNTHSTNNIIQ